MRENKISKYSGKNKNLNVIVIMIIGLIFVAVLFFIVYPAIINSGLIVTGESIKNVNAGTNTNLSNLKLRVSIPCSGHALLIINELKKANGVKDVSFEMPNYFTVSYNPLIISESEILGLDIFKGFPAIKVNDS